MRIDINNKSLIDKEIYVHDMILKNMVFDYDDKRLTVTLERENANKGEYAIEFCNVIGYNMQSCGCWGDSAYVGDWEVSGDRNPIEELLKKQNKGDYEMSRIKNKKESFFQTAFTLISGDRLVIVCEYIDIDEYENITIDAFTEALKRNKGE